MNEEEPIKKEMKLLITIISSLLLALAFFSNYETQYYSNLNQTSIVDVNIVWLFVFGVLILILAFANYNFPSKKNRYSLRYIWTYLFVSSFAFFFFKLFFNLLDQSTQSFGSNFEKIGDYLIATFSAETTLLFMIILLLIWGGIIIKTFLIKK